ncbi:tRNA uridine(34) 5-carboxymethylaminomethyl modification radical SAM/GNAT enzyme Elp3 [Candidatus Woesearchaeota archaeon]|nr:tRNA uridine(34) 5-carboxymethylaminomethyl modification radical SAM/GNAT enzyme Elp3 [Nanoarchaeota archaeon]MCB9370684.1 tRNA uridine(34) 5-carboxymethylaminomethyl modification radical SAM/GNAT enzyme Elp3 [Candidatus Woesearchaeota archaeon]USN43768.1 MAG: tRNA uridine(34) 5-carboxymethylaminomethyl modification radical SAM/GNAT enzyme Elp3 [Candidatus Woesearchaeota archaeon]
MPDKLYSSLLDELAKKTALSRKELNTLKIAHAKKEGLKTIVKNPLLLAHARSQSEREHLISLLNNKPVRELSGVTVVALFAKPHSCPHGKCMYCPGGPGSPYGDTPQSYTGKEPAALRASRNAYEPYFQIFNRLEHYVANGHDPDKIEMIFMGGTFPSLDKAYRDEFVNFAYKALNDFGEQFFFLNEKGKRMLNYEVFNEFFEMKSPFSKEREERIKTKVLKKKFEHVQNYTYEIERNEKALIRCIGLTIETKPDWCLEEHCNEALSYGCTRFELGVQTLNEDCLRKTNRGHSLEETKKAFQIAKDMCFKINAHMMLGLPASTLEIDEESLKDLFRREEFRPDMLKIYPCLVVQGTPLYKMWEKGLFSPIKTEEAAKIIARATAFFPRYLRLMRVQRDIPTTEIHGGIENSNLREFVDEEMKKLKLESADIRAREVGFRLASGKQLGTFDLHIQTYPASNGIEHFIDVVDEYDTMIGFIRLRFPSSFDLRPEIKKGTALIRELHVYGQTLAVGKESNSGVQHKGWGRKLLEKAEDIAKKEGYTKMAIISGVGVREYYKKFGYTKEGPYMVKAL